MSEDSASPTPHRIALTASWLGVLLIPLAVVLLLPVFDHREEDIATTGIQLPPAGGDVDYQLGGAYPVPSGVRTVVRDRRSPPADGVYNICYVNAFQVQPGEERQWSEELLLHDGDGAAVIDQDWDEVLLDLSTAGKRERAAAQVGEWIDGCATAGFDAVEPDNYDSYSRSQGLLTEAHATAYMALLAEHAHSRQLAIGQKNAAELTAAHTETGLDFAVAEQCGEYDECQRYMAAYGDHVIVVEYSDSGLANACTRWGDQLSVVRRDVELVPAGESGYLRETCASR